MFRRTLFSVPPPLLATPRVPTRNDMIARREALAAEERRVLARVEQLRSQMDDLSNALDRPSPPSTAQPNEPRPHAAPLAIVNAGRKARNLPLLTERDIERGPEQPKPQKIDPVATAAQIVAAGNRRRGETPQPLPKDPTARLIVLAGYKRRGEEPPDD
jgi:hypothetical protein